MQHITKDGQSWWDMSDEDYLADFEMFHNEFDKPETKKEMYIAKPFDDPRNTKIGEEPFPQTPADKARYPVDGFKYRDAKTAADDPVMSNVVKNQTVLDRSTVRGVNASDEATAERGADVSSMAAVFSPVHASEERRHHLDTTARKSVPRMQSLDTPAKDDSKGKGEAYPSPLASRPPLSEDDDTPMGGEHVQTREGVSVRFADLEDSASESVAKLQKAVQAADKTPEGSPEREAAMQEVESASAVAEAALATVAAAKQLDESQKQAPASKPVVQMRSELRILENRIADIEKKLGDAAKKRLKSALTRTTEQADKLYEELDDRLFDELRGRALPDLEAELTAKAQQLTQLQQRTAPTAEELSLIRDLKDDIDRLEEVLEDKRNTTK